MVNKIKNHLLDKSKIYIYDFILDGKKSYLTEAEIEYLNQQIDKKNKRR